MSRWQRQALTAAFAGFATLVLAGCDDGDGGSPGASTGTPAAAVTVTETATAVTAADLEAAFPGVPLALIVDVALVDERTVTLTSTYASGDSEAAAALCEAILRIATFHPRPQIEVLADDGATPLAECARELT